MNTQLEAFKREARARVAYTSYRRDYLARLRHARTTGNRMAKRGITFDALMHRMRAGIGKRRCVLTGQPY